MSPLVTPCPGNPVGENPTLEVAPRLTFDIVWHSRVMAIDPTEREKGLPVVLHPLVKWRIGRGSSMRGGGSDSHSVGQPSVSIVAKRHSGYLLLYPVFWIPPTELALARFADDIGE
jgi:hypothetical protein